MTLLLLRLLLMDQYLVFLLFPFGVAILVRNGWVRGLRRQHFTQRWLRWPLIVGAAGVAVLAGFSSQWITLGLAASFAWAATFDPEEASRVRPLWRRFDH